MVFANLEEIEHLTLEEKKRLLNPKNRFKLVKNLHRSNMMLNPLNLKHLNRLDSLEADAVTLNLEDAIAPARKKEALINIALFLSHMQSTKSEIIIRINPLDSGGKDEIAFLKAYCFNAIRISKVKREKEIDEVAALLGDKKKIHISLETKEAFQNLASWQPREEFERANLGILDLLADLQLPQSLLHLKNPTIEYILTKFLIDAKTIGVEAVSFMYQEYQNLTEFRELLIWEKSLGYRSKACMGPAQVTIANEILAPSAQELKRAVEIKEAFEANAQKAINGFMHPKYGFIDEPIYKDALNMLNGVEKDLL